jgi:transposase
MTVRRLARLLERERKAYLAWDRARDELARATMEAREKEGLSTRAVARALGVGASTVQGWTRRGKQLG